MDIVAQLNWRYAVKKFDDKKVLSQEKVDRLKMAFNLTATSYGLQPIKMIVLQNKELQRKLIPYSFDQQQVGQASHVLVICIENTIDSAYITEYFDNVKKIRGTSDDILTSFKEALVQDFSRKDDREIKDWSKNQAYLALGNLLTICALEEIDSCPMEGFLPDEYNKLLGLEKRGLTSVLVLPIGYRADNDDFSRFKKVRKRLEESIIEIK